MDAPGLLLRPAVVLRAFYLLAAALILAIQAVPALRRRFLAYGSRATSSEEAPSAQPPRAPYRVDALLDYAASLQVPHSFFTHFYVVSVASSAFWGLRLTLWKAGGSLFVVWALMLLQGVRRLLESHAYTSSSTSTMSFAHWVLGLVFYLATSVAVWIEDDPGAVGEAPARRSRELGLESALLVPAILTAHVLQHVYHAYLYRLRTQNSDYQLPSHPLFPNLLCPHYTCEIAIYALLSVLAAPSGHIVNWTLLSATVFVAVNLGVTAAGTKEWYTRKFGADKVRHRRRMIPWVW